MESLNVFTKVACGDFGENQSTARCGNYRVLTPNNEIKQITLNLGLWGPNNISFQSGFALKFLITTPLMSYSFI